MCLFFVCLKIIQYFSFIIIIMEKFYLVNEIARPIGFVGDLQ